MSRRDLLLLLVLSAIWGSSFLFIKLGVDEVEPSVVAFGRLALGTLTLLPLLLWHRGRASFRDNLRVYLVLGAVHNAVPYWLLSFAETRIDSGLAAVIQAAAPIFTVVLALRLDPSQHVRGARLAGTVGAFVGVAMLVGVQEGGQLVGALAVIGVALCYAVSVLYAGRAARHIPAFEVSLGQLGVGAVLIAPLALVQLPGELPPAGALLAIVVLGTVGTGIAYLVYFALIAGAGASRAILVTYLVPAFALVYGAFFLDEPVTASALGGLALILAGTALATGAVRRRGSVAPA